MITSTKFRRSPCSGWASGFSFWAGSGGVLQEVVNSHYQAQRPNASGRGFLPAVDRQRAAVRCQFLDQTPQQRRPCVARLEHRGGGAPSTRSIKHLQKRVEAHGAHLRRLKGIKRLGADSSHCVLDRRAATRRAKKARSSESETFVNGAPCPGMTVSTSSFVIVSSTACCCRKTAVAFEFRKDHAEPFCHSASALIRTRSSAQ